MGKMSPIKFPMLSSETTKYKKTLAHQQPNEASRDKKHTQTYFTLTFYLNIIGSLDFFLYIHFLVSKFICEKNEREKWTTATTHARKHASTKKQKL